MKKALTIAAMAASALAGTAAAQDAERPPIVSVSHLALYAEDTEASRAFYVDRLGAVAMPDPEDPAGTRYHFSPDQFVEVLPLPEGHDSVNRMAHAAFNTDDAEALRRYLQANGVAVPDAVTRGDDASMWFTATDPEGTKVQFVQPPQDLPDVPVNPLSEHIIHVGYIVSDRALQDEFYIDLLGFRPYWEGGPNPDEPPQWVSLKLPDGSDWLEYMVVGTPGQPGIPEGMSQRLAGIFNHFALGTTDITRPYEHLWVHDMVNEQDDELPKIGADAKWQLNLYDPDGTRAEFMEYTPVGEPCCSPYTAEHPTAE